MYRADASVPPLKDATVAAPVPSRAAEAWQDIVTGLQKSWLWGAMAMQDIRLRYRGSLLGPFWLTLSTVIMILAMGVIYARLFHMEAKTYLPYLSVGLVVWQFVSGLINEGCQTFISVQNIILQAPMPFSVHAYRLTYRNLIVMVHNFAIVPIILWFFHVPVGWQILLIVPALLLFSICGVWVSILFGMVSARFRDIPPIIASFVQVLFFVTPVFWSADALGKWKTVAELNPLFAAIDIVRAPLLGTPPASSSWPVMIGVTIAGGIVTFLFFSRFRSRIAFWV